MLQRLFGGNYKSLVNFTLKFDHLALLVGANGAGKTSVCNIIFALRELLRASPESLSMIHSARRYYFPSD